jgi:hypothetical protein
LQQRWRSDFRSCATGIHIASIHSFVFGKLLPRGSWRQELTKLSGGDNCLDDCASPH